MSHISTATPVREPDGILLVDKPAGMTSHDVVFRVRRLFGTKKVGHTGTLDPMATGVLILLLGRAAKACEYVSHDEKAYVATLRLGLTTDTEDTTGTILSVTSRKNIPTDDDVDAILSRFRGPIHQIPPMYSALKVNGRKLCDIARSGGVVEREARPVEIRTLERTAGVLPSDHTLFVRCSGGTYIRTLCADIGAALGCGGAMASLRRVEAGGMGIGECRTLAELESMSMDERLACLLPAERLFDDLPAVTLPPFFHTLCRNGCEIYQQKLNTNHPMGARVRLCDENGAFFAIGEVGRYEGGTAIKAIKIFIL